MPKMLLFSSSRNTQWIKITFELSNVIFIPEWMELGVDGVGTWSGGIHGVRKWMEWGSVWSGGMNGVWEWMECASGWSVGVDGVWEWMECGSGWSGGVYGLHGCDGVWVQF